MLSFASLHYASIDCVSLVIVALGILVQARVGIGFALISAPILFLINPAFMPGPILILGFVLSLLLFLSEKQALSLALVLPAVIARLPGSWVAILVLAYLPQWLLSLMIGLSLLCASFFSLMKVSDHFKPI
ncbi:TSUP family transporter [Pseudomonas sp. HK3]